MRGWISRFLLGILTLTALTLSPAACAQEQQPKKLTPDELKALLEKNPKLFFLDVREPKEIEMLGTMRGYVNIPLSQLEKRVSEIPKERLVVTA